MFREVASFDVHHGTRAWPWLTFTADHELVGFATATAIETRRRVGRGPSFALPAGFALTMFAIAPTRAAIASDAELVVLAANGESKSAKLEALLGDATLSALAFDRKNERIWLSAESPTETVIALVDVGSLALVGSAKSPAFPRPALHEIHVHQQDDAILLLAACGESGTFARVVGFAGDEVSAVPGALDEGAVAAGFVGFSSDGMRVHLVEADELRTHAWPTLHELSSVPLADDFVSSFSGVVLGHEIYVDGELADSQEDAVMQYDRAAIHGIVLPEDAPEGMWAGRLGANAIVTITPSGDPAPARIVERVATGRKSPGVS